MKNSKKLWLIIGLILIANIIYYFGLWGGDNVLQWVSDGLPVLCSFIAIFGLWQAYKSFQKFDFTKIAWLMILIGIISFFLAEITYGLLEVVLKVNMDETYPSTADYFWCFGYLPMFVGLFIMLIGYKKSGLPLGNPKLYIAIIGVFVLVSLIVGRYILIPMINDPELDLLTKTFYLLYPTLDLLLVIPAILLMYITSLFGGAIISKPWKYLTYGFIFFTIADLLYSYLDWLGLYGNGNFIEIAWNAAYLLIGLAGIYQKELVESLKKN